MPSCDTKSKRVYILFCQMQVAKRWLNAIDAEQQKLSWLSRMLSGLEPLVTTVAPKQTRKPNLCKATPLGTGNDSSTLKRFCKLRSFFHYRIRMFHLLGGVATITHVGFEKHIQGNQNIHWIQSHSTMLCRSGNEWRKCYGGRAAHPTKQLGG